MVLKIRNVTTAKCTQYELTRIHYINVNINTNNIVLISLCWIFSLLSLKTSGSSKEKFDMFYTTHDDIFRNSIAQYVNNYIVRIDITTNCTWSALILIKEHFNTRNTYNV